MFGYYFHLALRSLRRSPVLTALMVLTLALGIGASITTLAVMKLLTGDPLPDKSARLVHPMLDVRAPEGYVEGRTPPQNLMPYDDALAVLNARKGRHQALVTVWGNTLKPDIPDHPPFLANSVFTTADFFPMFEVPFRYGGGWSAEDDGKAVQVIVISDDLNRRLFGGENSVGKSIHMRDHFFRIVGVMKPWSPQPRFYALDQPINNRNYGTGDDVFFPIAAAKSTGLSGPAMSCKSRGGDVPENALCAWTTVWVELADAGEQRTFKDWLDGYAREQVRAGRYTRRDVAASALMDWMRGQNLVPDDARQQTFLAFGFLVVCVVNTVGLLLAKCLRRSREVGVRRALGATRSAIFGQFIVEAAVVGLAGGVLGLLLAEAGLWFVRQQPAPYAAFVTLDPALFLLTFLIAVVASLLAGILPAWRASLVAPAPQLKGE